jgi:hypothetical protein
MMQRTPRIEVFLHTLRTCRMIRNWLTLTILATGVLAGCSYKVQVREEDIPRAYSDEPYARVLAACVHEGLVDYKRLQSDHVYDLDIYLAELERFGPTQTPDAFGTDDDKLAYYINAYNAAVLKKMVDAGIPILVPGVFFLVDKFYIDGDAMTLVDLENKIIIGKFRRPAANFALVHGRISDPPLPAEPFRGKDLDQQLRLQGETYLASPHGLKFRGSTLDVSPLFWWHAREFEQAYGDLKNALVAFAPPDKAAEIAAIENPGINIMAYDWALNSAP